MNIEEQKSIRIGPFGRSDVRSELLNKNLTEIMRYMDDLGWEADCSLGRTGWGTKPGFIIHFSRWGWHGRKSERIDYFASEHDTTDADLNLCARLAGEKALRAWETFTDVLPGNELIDGRIPAAWEGLQEIWLG